MSVWSLESPSRKNRHLRGRAPRMVTSLTDASCCASSWMRSSAQSTTFSRGGCRCRNWAKCNLVVAKMSFEDGVVVIAVACIEQCARTTSHLAARRERNRFCIIWSSGEQLVDKLSHGFDCGIFTRDIIHIMSTQCKPRSRRAINIVLPALNTPRCSCLGNC